MCLGTSLPICDEIKSAGILWPQQVAVVRTTCRNDTSKDLRSGNGTEGLSCVNVQKASKILSFAAVCVKFRSALISPQFNFMLR